MKAGFSVLGERTEYSIYFKLVSQNNNTKAFHNKAERLGLIFYSLLHSCLNKITNRIAQSAQAFSIDI